MPLRILIVPDKFKGTLAAPEAAQAMARGWCRARPSDRLELLPMCDGGDGFGMAMGQLLGARVRMVRTVDAAHRACRGKWWWAYDTRTAIIESAAVIGLALLPPGKYHPFYLDTFGLGAVFDAALRAGARRFLVGIGGSATNDAGFGLARALGWRFLDSTDSEIKTWIHLHKLAALKPPPERRRFREVLVAVDVRNPLLGPSGATRVYGPQKGLRSKDFPLAEKCLRHLAQVVRRDLGRDFAEASGAGAAGGLGFGLAAFLGARLTPGFQMFAKMARLEQRLRAVDCVLTGEGQIDRSTLMGKGVGEIAKLCRGWGKPCFGLAGSVSTEARGPKLFSVVHALADLTSIEDARARPAFWLERLARRVAQTTPDRLNQ